MSTRFQVFIGYDPRQPVSHAVAWHSLVRHASKPLAVTRLQLDQLPISRRGLTEFTYSRFLAPYLSHYDGYSLFLDADMLVLGDVWELLGLVDPSAAVSVVMHKEKFERPSLMLFNNKRCQVLSPGFVENQGNPLMDLAWASKVGALPAEWNHLVGYSSVHQYGGRLPKNIHYTKGVPCWPETRSCDYAALWNAERLLLDSTCSFQELMGGSVHVQAPQNVVVTK